MRAKRAKNYRKQLQYLRVDFKFREPYQILLDDQIILEATKIQFDLLKALRLAVQATIRPMITQCCMEALYESKNRDAIALAKTFERRKCGHLPANSSSSSSVGKKKTFNDHDDDNTKNDNKDKNKQKSESEFEGTKSSGACIWTVVAVDKSFNKHRYLVATQDYRLRARLRKIPAIPLLYIKRSVMVMEPMSEATAQARERIETAKLTGGLNAISVGMKRKTLLGISNSDTNKKNESTEDSENDDNDDDDDNDDLQKQQQQLKKKKKVAKGPHPLSVLKKKKKVVESSSNTTTSESKNGEEKIEKKKRRRKHHSGNTNGDKIEVQQKQLPAVTSSTE